MYELIGMVVVWGTVLVIVSIFTLAVSYVVWYRGLSKAINLCWKGYDWRDGETPPRRRRLLAIFLLSLRDLDLEPWRRRDELVDKIEKEM